MRYVFGLLLPALLQGLVVLGIILANTGNGSFAGLAAYLLGLFVIPLTLIFNGFYIYSHREYAFTHVMVRCYLFGFFSPFLVLLFFFIS